MSCDDCDKIYIEKTIISIEIRTKVCSRYTKNPQNSQLWEKIQIMQKKKGSAINMVFQMKLTPLVEKQL